LLQNESTCPGFRVRVCVRARSLARGTEVPCGASYRKAGHGDADGARGGEGGRTTYTQCSHHDNNQGVAAATMAVCLGDEGWWCCLANPHAPAQTGAKRFALHPPNPRAAASSTPSWLVGGGRHVSTGAMDPSLPFVNRIYTPRGAASHASLPPRKRGAAGGGRRPARASTNINIQKHHLDYPKRERESWPQTKRLDFCCRLQHTHRSPRRRVWFSNLSV
jgi:hypothetical protein